MKSIRALAIASLFIVAAGSLSAETIEYPKEDPLFTVEVPEDWQVHAEDDGALTVQTSDVSVVAVFDSRVKGVKNAATAKEAVAAQKKATAGTTGFTDFREIRPIQEMKLSPTISGFGAQYHAKFPTGEPCIYMIVVFTPDGEKYCTMEMSIKARALTGAAEKEWQGLLDSITPTEKSDE